MSQAGGSPRTGGSEFTEDRASLGGSADRVPKVHLVGEAAVMLDVSAHPSGGLAGARELLDSLRRARQAGAIAFDQAIPGAHTVLLRGGGLARRDDDDATALLGDVLTRFADVPGQGGEAESTAPTVIPVVYDGADLEEVASLTGLSAQEVVARHTGSLFDVAFTGFAPGFAYLAGGDKRIAVPRRSEPRVRIPAGAVGLAGEFSGVYPRESPGGWQLIGHTELAMWDPKREDPATLQPGRTVKFEFTREHIRAADGSGRAQDSASSNDSVSSQGTMSSQESASSNDSTSSERSDADEKSRAHSSEPDPSGEGDAGPQEPAESAERAESTQPTEPTESAESTESAEFTEPTESAKRPVAVFTVVDPGLGTVFQDGGRPGLADLGVSASGAADRPALFAANRLVGNEPDAACLEIGLGGMTAEAVATTVVALAGAPRQVRVKGPHGTRSPGTERAFRLDPGERLIVGPPTRGLRTMLAVRGGFDAPETLGSRSADTLAGLGPEALAAGQKLSVPAGTDAPRPRPVSPPDPARPGPGDYPESGEETVLRVVPGPRDDWFAGGGLDHFLSEAWEVTAQSNRVGVRLDGPPIPRAEAYQKVELPSEGLIPGSIQVPAGGLPVLFLADHPLTGGYPVIATVIAADIPLAAQLPQGARVRFESYQPQPKETP